MINAEPFYWRCSLNCKYDLCHFCCVPLGANNNDFIVKEIIEPDINIKIDDDENKRS